MRSRWLAAGVVAGLLAGGPAQGKPPNSHPVEKATFAAGCFWSIQEAFDPTPGVLKTTVGYTGGSESSPTYNQVASGKTGHAESIEIVYDPQKVSYEKLLDVFWHNINPTTKNGQFPDWGTQYRTVIFYRNEAQRQAALLSMEKLNASKRFGASIVTAIQAAEAFWPAETYHQKYYLKSPEPYHQYHDHSGRDEYFRKVWGL